MLTQNDVEKIAEKIKKNQMKRRYQEVVPLFSDCRPTWEEIQYVWMLIRELEDCGYEVKEKSE